MSNERNNETQDALKREVKALQSSCADACKIIENAPSDTNFITPDNIVDTTNSYIERVRIQIENSKTPLVTDENLLTSQFLTELKQRSEEIEMLKALNRAHVHDIANEINRLESLINTSEEALAKPKVQRLDVRPEHLQKAKEKFQTMKSDLHELIQALFPDNWEFITDILGRLMQQRLTEASNGYMEVTSENYQVIELLKDANLVTVNPYNNMEVKLAY